MKHVKKQLLKRDQQIFTWLYFRDGSSVVIQDVWYIFGGDSGRNFLSDVEVYDPKGIYLIELIFIGVMI